MKLTESGDSQAGYSTFLVRMRRSVSWELGCGAERGQTGADGSGHSGHASAADARCLVPDPRCLVPVAPAAVTDLQASCHCLCTFRWCTFQPAPNAPPHNPMAATATHNDNMLVRQRRKQSHMPLTIRSALLCSCPAYPNVTLRNPSILARPTNRCEKGGVPTSSSYANTSMAHALIHKPT